MCVFFFVRDLACFLFWSFEFWSTMRTQKTSLALKNLDESAK